MFFTCARRPAPDVDSAHYGDSQFLHNPRPGRGPFCGPNASFSLDGRLTFCSRANSNYVALPTRVYENRGARDVFESDVCRPQRLRGDGVVVREGEVPPCDTSRVTQWHFLSGRLLDNVHADNEDMGVTIVDIGHP
ncbi:hypothetical protein EVAR_41412_1 [Eumeta japonica]|uniref:Uncharacterized protein n=1 Tax=Eumeta variegata TaxID=151549 RepID=A0A4C1W6A2_EUMVA|nr:hypothetical protein EVAR_41412_1 [Eumeta japonica]